MHARSAEQETLQPGAFMRARDFGSAKEQFDRIRSTLASILEYKNDKVWFHIDEVKMHIFKDRCPHEDNVAAEGSTDENSVEAFCCRTRHVWCYVHSC